MRHKDQQFNKFLNLIQIFFFTFLGFFPLLFSLHSISFFSFPSFSSPPHLFPPFLLLLFIFLPPFFHSSPFPSFSSPPHLLFLPFFIFSLFSTSSFSSFSKLPLFLAFYFSSFFSSSFSPFFSPPHQHPHRHLLLETHPCVESLEPLATLLVLVLQQLIIVTQLHLKWVVANLHQPVTNLEGTWRQVCVSYLSKCTCR